MDDIKGDADHKGDDDHFAEGEPVAKPELDTMGLDDRETAPEADISLEGVLDTKEETVPR